MSFFFRAMQNSMMMSHLALALSLSLSLPNQPSACLWHPSMIQSYGEPSRLPSQGTFLCNRCTRMWWLQKPTYYSHTHMYSLTHICKIQAILFSRQGWASEVWSQGWYFTFVPPFVPPLLPPRFFSWAYPNTEISIVPLPIIAPPLSMSSPAFLNLNTTGSVTTSAVDAPENYLAMWGRPCRRLLMLPSLIFLRIKSRRPEYMITPLLSRTVVGKVTVRNSRKERMHRYHRSISWNVSSLLSFSFSLSLSLSLSRMTSSVCVCGSTSVVPSPTLPSAGGGSSSSNAFDDSMSTSAVPSPALPSAGGGGSSSNDDVCNTYNKDHVSFHVPPHTHNARHVTSRHVTSRPILPVLFCVLPFPHDRLNAISLLLLRCQQLRRRKEERFLTLKRALGIVHLFPRIFSLKTSHHCKQ